MARFAVAGVAAMLAVADGANKPHILMLLADDFGWANAGVFMPLTG